MEGTPQLLTDVKFTQLRKGGYDPEEVDNYLERINEAVAKLADNLRSATERAEAAQAQLADARRAQADAEAELEQVRSGEGAVSGVPADEQLAKVLVLAQRAADQAIDEANATATKTLADARAKSVNLLAEAEQERERLLVKAHKKADAVAEERARTLQTQVTELETARNELEADVAALEGFLDDERDRLRGQVETISRALDEPEGLRLAAPPELLDPPIPTLELATERDEPSPFVSAGSGSERPTDDRPTEAMALLDDELSDDFAATGDADDADQADLESATDSDGGWSDRLPGVDDDGRDDDDPFVTPEVGTVDGLDEGPWRADRESETIYLDEHGSPTQATDTDSHLFGDSSAPAGADAPLSPPPEKRAELFTPEPGEEPTLGEPDEEADAAMRAFFERDLDDPSAATRPRFGRRR